MRCWIGLVLAIGLLAAAACGSAGGVVSGSSESCTVNGAAGNCTGRIAKLSGTYDKVVKAEGCHTNVAVAVEVSASVQTGVLHVLTTGPDGTEYTAQALPGQPATLTGAAAGCLAEFHVTFAADQGEATGIEYTIRYSMP